MQTTTETPAARATDPCTSHEAAEALEASGRMALLRERVRQALIEHGQEGVTSAELAEISGIDYGTVERRLSELRGRPGGAVVRGYPDSPERRRNPRTRRSAMVWRPVCSRSEVA